MDNILVGIIVAAAVFFSVRSFIRTYKGQGGCNCAQGTCKTSQDKAGHCCQSQGVSPLDKKQAGQNRIG